MSVRSLCTDLQHLAVTEVGSTFLHMYIDLIWLHVTGVCTVGLASSRVFKRCGNHRKGCFASKVMICFC